MSANIKGEQNNQTIVMLPGTGELSPILQFKPIAEDLSDRFKVVTIEPFGYGLSDLTDKERTLDNVSSEIHGCIEKLGLKNYYLMGHSISGLHALKLSNLYPQEIAGVVGLDTTFPMTQEKIDFLDSLSEGTGNTDTLLKIKPILDILGITHIIATPEKFGYLDPNYSYSEQDKQLFKALAVHRYGNKNSKEEIANTSKWIQETVGMKYPESTPVLNFVSSDNCDRIPFWEEEHENVISDKQHSEVIKLQGSHYIHVDQRSAVVQKVKEWIQ
ncbi:alpha/beta-hydrolase [Neocallimastix lanati (nom. inval.)]|nr:alpha/beta-hydrolase [Neocallimastix sp. JGI-2020a]